MRAPRLVGGGRRGISGSTGEVHLASLSGSVVNSASGQAKVQCGQPASEEKAEGLCSSEPLKTRLTSYPILVLRNQIFHSLLPTSHPPRWILFLHVLHHCVLSVVFRTVNLSAARFETARLQLRSKSLGLHL